MVANFRLRKMQFNMLVMFEDKRNQRDGVDNFMCLCYHALNCMMYF